MIVHIYPFIVKYVFAVDLYIHTRQFLIMNINALVFLKEPIDNKFSII